MYKIDPFIFTYDKTSEKKLLNETAFTLPNTGLILVTGPSGSGKSTFLNLLKGIIPEFIHGHLDGDIKFNNKNLDGENFQKNLKEIVYLFQNPYSQIINNETADEFFFSLENFNIDFEESKRLQAELSHKFNLDNLWGKKTQNLSHGECQKLLLASLLALSPKVVLLDEPTAFLDPFERKNFYNMLDLLKKNHLIVIIDHHINEILSKLDMLITVNKSGIIKLSKELIVGEFISPVPDIFFQQYFSPNVIIDIKKLHFSYDKYQKLIDIENESIQSGEVVIIKGRNGTGKSTLLKLIAGFIPAKNGGITILKDNSKLSKKEIFSEMGYIFQDPENSFLFDSLEEELGDQSFGFTPQELERSPHLFSEGEKRRISIFIALAQKKNILLYDEPTFGQDKNNIKTLVDIILKLKKINKLQIIISHDDDFIAQVGDRFLSLRDDC